MAIVAFDGGALDMLSTWSHARELPRAFHVAMARRPAASSGSPSAASRPPACGQLAQPTVEAAAAAGSTPASSSTSSPTSSCWPGRSASGGRGGDTLRGFASPPGRKVMLLLSGGWPFSPADYVVNDPGRPILDREVQCGATCPPARRHREPARLHRLSGRRAGDGGQTVTPPPTAPRRRPRHARAGDPPLARVRGRGDRRQARCSTPRAAGPGGRRRTPAPTTGWASPRSASATTSATRSRSTCSAGAQRPLARQLPRPVAQGRGLDDGRERAALRQPAGRRAAAHRDRRPSAGAAGDRGAGHARHPGRAITMMPVAERGTIRGGAGAARRGRGREGQPPRCRWSRSRLIPEQPAAGSTCATPRSSGCAAPQHLVVAVFDPRGVILPPRRLPPAA